MAAKKGAGESGAKRARKKKAEPRSRGLEAPEVASREPPAKVRELAEKIAEDGGQVLATYKDPLGGTWLALAALPLEKVEPTAFQRDVSEAHATRLSGAIEKLGRYLDPVIAVRSPEGRYLVPNGGHRVEAMRRLGARAIVALVVPDQEVAYRILLMNTEKAHNLRERSLEVVRMARDLARIDDRAERDFAEVFEEPSFLTLGLCYEQNGRFPGSAYNPVLRRVEVFSSARLSRSLEERAARREALFELDQAVSAAVEGLKARGFESPYLRSYVIARINPLQFQRGKTGEFAEVIGKMLSGAQRFDLSKVKADSIARTGGPPPEE